MLAPAPGSRRTHPVSPRRAVRRPSIRSCYAPHQAIPYGAGIAGPGGRAESRIAGWTIEHMKVGVLQFFSWSRRIPLPEVYARAFSRIEIMDRTGYDCVWLAEHHFNTY